MVRPGDLPRVQIDRMKPAGTVRVPRGERDRRCGDRICDIQGGFATVPGRRPTIIVRRHVDEIRRRRIRRAVRARSETRRPQARASTPGRERRPVVRNRHHGGSISKFARADIDTIQIAVSAGLRQDLLPVREGDERWWSADVPRSAGRYFSAIPTLRFSGSGIEHDDGTALRIPHRSRSEIGPGIPGRYVQQPLPAIESDRRPIRAARFADVARAERKPPRNFTGEFIECDDLTASAEVRAVRPDDHQTVFDDRRRIDVFARSRPHDFRLPKVLAGGGVESQDAARVDSAKDDAAVITDAAIAGEFQARRAQAVLPARAARRGIERVRVFDRRHIHRAVDDRRSGRKRLVISEREAANAFELCNVRDVDLVERRIAGSGVIAVIAEPVGGCARLGRAGRGAGYRQRRRDDERCL